ncbi:hypothetical protein D3C71_2141610 [compost metagenome]
MPSPSDTRGNSAAISARAASDVTTCVRDQAPMMATSMNSIRRRITPVWRKWRASGTI